MRLSPEFHETKIKNWSRDWRLNTSLDKINKTSGKEAKCTERILSFVI